MPVFLTNSKKTLENFGVVFKLRLEMWWVIDISTMTQYVLFYFTILASIMTENLTFKQLCVVEYRI